MQKRFDSLLSSHYNLAHANAYGLISLKFDTMTLSDNTLRISDLKAVMPDGLMIDYPSDEFTQALEVDLMPYKEKAKTAPIRVFLCVPEFIPGQSSVIGEWPRYNSVEGKTVGDENLSDNVIAIPRLLPKLSLIVSDTYPARYVSFPLVELVFQDESFSITSFMPAYVSISPEHVFHERARFLVNRIREKAQFLSDKWQKQVGTVMLTETTTRLTPLMKVLPILEGFLRNRSFSPQQLYDLLCYVLGEFSTMRLSQVPSLVPAYTHDNLNGCLVPLFDLIESFIDSIEQSVVVLPFGQRERLFYLKMQESFLQNNMYIGLRAPSTMNEDQLGDWMRDAVICCDSMVETARIKRVSGVGRAILDDDEASGLFTGRGTLIFKIDTASEYFKVGENLNIFNASDNDVRRPVGIMLYLEKNDETPS